MSSTVSLLLGLHNHQPVGNFDHVLERAYQQAYAPFLAALERHPAIKTSLHCSGSLWDWLEARRPEYVEKVARLAKSGSLEVIGGGYYEPILATLPEQDQKGQVERMQEFIADRFGASPRGLWLAERVWEPQLPGVLKKLGVEYTIVDDAHFMAVGFPEKDLRGYFLTEDAGREVKVFPISQRLRYLMPFAAPEEAISYLSTFRDEAPGEAALVMADDGEKFGLWPRTHATVYEEGWLERFLELLEKNSSWLKTRTFSEYLDANPPLGRAYLPATSYAELEEWALTPESAREYKRHRAAAPERHRQFVRGAHFRNFLHKYPEASRMYRKMLRVSKKVKAARDGGEARARLWKGQCNCAYWHGVFGGLYLPHLRHAVYENLLAAERLVDKAAFSVSRDDWDADGVAELLVESPKANWYFAPGKGGGLWEWDVKDAGVNLGAVVSRRPEAYHEDLSAAKTGEAAGGAHTIHEIVRAKEPGLERRLHYDWHARMSLLDHFLHPDTRLEDFATARYGEQGDFVLGRYQVSAAPRKTKDGLTFSLERVGRVWDRSVEVPVRVAKTIALKPSGAWEARYSIVNEGKQPAQLWLGVELVAAFVTPDAFGAKLEAEENVAMKACRDEARNLTLKLHFREPMSLWAFPLETISQSEEGFERTYQGSVMLAHRRLALAAGARAEFVISAESA